jgi:hypothetical protein
LCHAAASKTHHSSHGRHDQQFSRAIQAFASRLNAQPPEVQETFQFLLATAMREAGKFEFVSVIDEQRSKK